MKHKLVMFICAALLLLGGCAATPQDTAVQDVDDSVYIGEYLSSDTQEADLEIAHGEDGKYIVQIAIFRLTVLSDGVGEMKDGVMTFSATDASGNPIGGTITADGETATVTFTDSTWEGLPNGSEFVYTKSSGTPNVWSE